MPERRRRPHPLWELARVRTVEFLREKGAVFWVFVFPVLLAVGLGLAFRHRPPDRSRIAVISTAPRAERLAGLTRKSAELEVRLMERPAALDAMRRGRVDLLVIPGPGAGDEPFRLTYRHDPARPEGRVARLVVDRVIQRSLGRKDMAAVEDVTTVEPGSRYIDFLMPGLVGLNLMGSSMWGLGFVVVNARRRKLLKRYAATPMRRSHFLLSFMLSRLVLLAFEVAFLFGCGWLIFDIQIRGSLLALAAVSLAGALSFSGLSLLVAARPRSTESVSGWMNFVMLPMWVLSGSFFSYERFPEVMHPYIRLLPLTALNDAIRAIVSDGASLWSVASSLATLLVMGLVAFVIALRIFRWQ